MSDNDPLEIVVIKGFDSEIGSLLIVLTAKATLPSLGPILAILLLEFVFYGLNIFSTYVSIAQENRQTSLSKSVDFCRCFVLIKKMQVHSCCRTMDSAIKNG